MQHHVKTKIGVTTDFYMHKANKEKFGEGQGKTSSPSKWLFQSSTLLNALHLLCRGIFLFSVCKQFVERRVAEAYVDDADCTYVDQRDQENETPTRRQLSHDKTYWLLIWWTWDKGVARMATKEEVPIDLSIQFENETTKRQLKRKDPTESI
eukprot:371533-Ditylum_brightwellii.AAC.1